MSLKKIEQVKTSKVFKIWDLIIYGAILLLVAVLFIVFFTTGNHDPLSGVRIRVRGEVVFEYEFGAEPKTLSERVEIEEDGESITVIIRTEKEYNKVYIDKTAKTVKMADANCNGKDCVSSFKMKNNSSLPIYCNPHGMVIEPFWRDFSGNEIGPF